MSYHKPRVKQPVTPPVKHPATKHAAHVVVKHSSELVYGIIGVGLFDALKDTLASAFLTVAHTVVPSLLAGSALGVIAIGSHIAEKVIGEEA